MVVAEHLMLYLEGYKALCPTLCFPSAGIPSLFPVFRPQARCLLTTNNLRYLYETYPLCHVRKTCHLPPCLRCMCQRRPSEASGSTYDYTSPAFDRFSSRQLQFTRLATWRIATMATGTTVVTIREDSARVRVHPTRFRSFLLLMSIVATNLKVRHTGVDIHSRGCAVSKPCPSTPPPTSPRYGSRPAKLDQLKNGKNQPSSPIPGHDTTPPPPPPPTTPRYGSRPAKLDTLKYGKKS